MELLLRSRPSVKDTTLGRLYVVTEPAEHFIMHTLEDRVREVPGVPVETWKLVERTAIPSGRYEIVLEDSPKFGLDTMTLKDVPGFSYIRIHGGNDDADTEGCILVGDAVIEDAEGDGGNIAPGSSRPALRRLKDQVRTAIARGEQVWITVVRSFNS